MELMRVKKIGSILEVFLKIGLVLEMILLAGFYFVIKKLEINMNLFLIMIYPCGICFLAFTYQFVRLFRLLKINMPFSRETIIYLKRSMYFSFSIAFLVALAFYFLLFYNFYTLGIKVCVAFIGILFFGVGIALYILMELFKKALEYKEEIDLTI